MAIYHFSGTVISRSQGRSAVACAAYRSGEKLQDDKYDKTHDYTDKQDIAHTEILLPENAPAWMADRETLWNAVERNEKRKDAQLAREFNFALPRELTIDQNRELAREFVQETFVKSGMVVDLCIHNDRMPNGEMQPHAHVMLTMREVDAEKENGFGQKVRAWNDKDRMLLWREEWAEVANRHLALNGHDISIDHRSLKEQGIALEPQYKIGSADAKDRMARMEDHQRIAFENGERILADPKIALDSITQQQSTFTHHDLAVFINRHTLDAEQFSAVYEKVKSSDAMVALGQDDKGRDRFTTQEMLQLETRMVAQADSLRASERHGVSEKGISQALASRTLSAEQKTAFDHLVREGGLKCVLGFAGTGKSYLLGAAREAWESAGYQVQGVTLAGIAAENLEGSSRISSRTFASRCHYWDKGEQLLTARDVLVVDEAGMLSSRQMARLMNQAEAGGAKVVLVGDPQQLQAIEAGAAFRAIAERRYCAELTDIQRQQMPWQREATKSLATGEVGEAIRQYERHSHVHDFDTTASARSALVSVWNDARLSNPENTQIMLAYTRKDVLELNQQARELRQKQGELGEGVAFQTERGERVFAAGERVYFLKNDRNMGVMNGTLGTVESVREGSLSVRLDSGERGEGGEKGRQVSVSLANYNQLDYGYAATIHKSQGVTVDRSYVLASKNLDAQAFYVAMSRHRKSADLFYGRDVFPNRDHLVRVMSRDRSKDVSLDYPHHSRSDHDRQQVSRAFAEARGLNVSNVGEAGENRTKAENPGLAQSQQQKEQQSHQEKLRAFTEKTRIERESVSPDHRHRSVLQNNQQEQRSRRDVPGLGEFKRQFEQKNPERARSLRDEVLGSAKPDSREEMQATPGRDGKDGSRGFDRKIESMVLEFNRLEQMVEKGGRSSTMAKDHLEHLVEKMSQKKEIMAYVRERDKGMERKINEMAKTLERGRDRGMEMEL